MKILLTGGTGFVGSHLKPLLDKEGEVFSPSSSEFDLRSKEDCSRAVRGMDAVVHLAANVGGIGYNQEHPAELFYDNMSMGLHLMHEAYVSGVRKFVAIGTVCAYPKFTPAPFKESDLWNGYPEETNAPYGLAKKMQLVAAQAYRKQYGFNAIYLLPVNLYGPRDNFEPNSSHVIPALIRKFIEARDRRQESVTIWGSGKATREFLYVEDAATAIHKAFLKYNGREPVNIGSGKDIKISALAKLIKELTGYKGKVMFDKTKPDGQPKRLLDTTKATELFGFTATTEFTQGLTKTIEYFESVYQKSCDTK